MVKKYDFSNLRTAFYRLESELDEQLAASFPNHGDHDKIHKLIEDDLVLNNSDLKSYKKDDGRIYLSYPTSVIVGYKL